MEALRNAFIIDINRNKLLLHRSGMVIFLNFYTTSVQKQFISIYVNDKCISQCFHIEDLYTLKPMAQILLEMSQ